MAEEQKENQLELFNYDLCKKQALDNCFDFGYFIRTIYDLKLFNYTQKQVKITDVIKRNMLGVDVILEPQISQGKLRFLNEIDEDIFYYVMWQAMKTEKQIVYIPLKQISSDLGYNTDRIKESIEFLTRYKPKYASKDNELIFSTFFDSCMISERGRSAKTYIKLSSYIASVINEILLMNKNQQDKNKILLSYKKLFSIKNPLSKIIFKRITICDTLVKNQENQFYINEGIYSLLNEYGISFKNKQEKLRLNKRIEIALDQLKQINIIKEYKFIEVKQGKNIVDKRLSLIITKDFSNEYSSWQELKEKITQKWSFANLTNAGTLQPKKIQQ